jgi:hypothetical protein
MGEFLGVLKELAPKAIVTSLRVRIVHRDEECEGPRSFDVLEKLVAQPPAFVCAFDDPRNVCDHEGAIVRQLNHSKNGREGCEGVVSNPWTGIGNGGEEG